MKTPQTGRTLRRLPRFAALLMMGCLCLLPSEKSQGRAAKETAEVPTLVYRMTARNLKLWTKYRGTDPESGFNTTGGTEAPSEFQTVGPPSYFIFRVNLGY